MCTVCERERELARTWAAEVQRREASLAYAKREEGAARARAADHAASHPYRFEEGL